LKLLKCYLVLLTLNNSTWPHFRDWHRVPNFARMVLPDSQGRGAAYGWGMRRTTPSPDRGMENVTKDVSGSAADQTNGT
jgi:hypothetical protein